MKKLTQSQFIQKAELTHKDKFDLSKAIYTLAKNKITIICKIHGEFRITANGFLLGSKCLKCVGKNKNTVEIIKQFQSIFNKQYCYDNTSYVNTLTPIEVICRTHGSFLIKPKYHLKGNGCQKCGYERISLKKTLTLDNFIKKANDKHKNLYIYDNVNYYNNATKIDIICPKHGSFFQTPQSHLNGSGCPKCKAEKTSTRCRSTTEEFIKKAKTIHNDFYIYDNIQYINNKTKLTIKCPKHGFFKQNASNHLCGKGCTKCRAVISKEHQKILDFLSEYNIDYTVNDREIIKPLELDVFIPAKRLAIEIDGVYWHMQDECNKRDQRKNKICKEKNILLLRFTDVEINKNFNKVVQEILLNL